MPSLAELLIGSPDTDIDTPVDRSRVSRCGRTPISATYRLTSAIELYGAGGRAGQPLRAEPARLRERDRTPRPAAAGTIVDELFAVRIRASGTCCAPAAASACAAGRARRHRRARDARLPDAAVHLVAESVSRIACGPIAQVAPKARLARDVEFVVYGWSRAPIFDVRHERLDAARRRLPAARRVARAVLGDASTRDGQTFRVYFMSDRGGIYALGYPVITWFGHLINLAELVMLAAVLTMSLLLAGATLFNALTSRTAGERTRAAARESDRAFTASCFSPSSPARSCRSSSSPSPLRTYFASAARAPGVEDAAARTATVAQRLVEDYADAAAARRPATLESHRRSDHGARAAARSIRTSTSSTGTRLQATSAARSFASQLLPTRTPGDVYRAIVLDRLPTYVGVEAGRRLAAICSRRRRCAPAAARASSRCR